MYTGRGKRIAGTDRLEESTTDRRQVRSRKKVGLFGTLLSSHEFGMFGRYDLITFRIRAV
jgi:hypothetical protein